MAADEREANDLNRDPISDEPGAHPVGTGLGATSGALAGAAVGAIAGPLGAAVGGVAGAVAGGLAGKAAAEAVNPTAEEAFWRENYQREPYYASGRTFDDYGPAYRVGVAGRNRFDDPWVKLEPRLATEWERTRGSSPLAWSEASPASRAAWQRADEQLRGTHSSSGGAASAVGAMQSAGDNTGDRDDAVDVLEDLVECCKDGEYGFRAGAEQAKRADLRAIFLQRAEDCRGAAVELNQLVRQYGGTPQDGGSAMGAVHRGWVAVKTKLTTYDDVAVLEECERGEDNAKTRYRKALDKSLPADARKVVERQLQGVLTNHDQVKRLRDLARIA